MTIEFPKFPNDRRKKNPPNVTLPSVNLPTVKEQPSFSPVKEPKLVTTEDSIDSIDAKPADLSKKEIEDLKQLLKAQQKKKSLNIKPLPLLFGILVVGGLVTGIYYMYGNMTQAKTASSTTLPTVTTATTPKPTSISSGTATIPTQTPAPTAIAATTSPTPASTEQVPSSTPATSTTSSTLANNDNDVNKPLQVDTTQSNKPTTSAVISSDTKTSDTKISTNNNPSSTEMSKSNSSKSTGNAKGLSYDEFVKTSDNAVFIEPPTKVK